MNVIGVNGWSDYIAEGQCYLKAALGGRKRAAVFNNELLGNLIGLSLEKLLVGLCLRYGHMPADHTLAGIVAEADRVCPLERSLTEAILMLDHVQDLCSLDVHMPRPVSDGRIETLLEMNERLAAFVEEKAFLSSPQ
jgi:hypothetical protein